MEKLFELGSLYSFLDEVIANAKQLKELIKERQNGDLSFDNYKNIYKYYYIIKNCNVGLLNNFDLNWFERELESLNNINEEYSDLSNSLDMNSLSIRDMIYPDLKNKLTFNSELYISDEAEEWIKTNDIIKLKITNDDLDYSLDYLVDNYFINPVIEIPTYYFNNSNEDLDLNEYIINYFNHINIHVFIPTNEYFPVSLLFDDINKCLYLSYDED